MVTKKKKETLEKFFKAVDVVSHGPGEVYDLGLIISDKIKSKDLAQFAPRPKEVEVFIFSEKNHPEDFTEKMKSVFKDKKWLLVELKDGYLPGDAYNQLRFLSLNNHLQIFKDEGTMDIKMPQETRIIFLLDKKSAAKINNPNFINLFGPIINF